MDMETFIKQTEALNWKDLDMESEPEKAKKVSETVLVGRLVADRPLNKLAFHA